MIDFLNAAYYARPTESRDIDDLLLAFTILMTYRHRRGDRALGAQLAAAVAERVPPPPSRAERIVGLRSATISTTPGGTGGSAG